VARALDAVGRICFNRGLELVAKADIHSAENYLCAACALLPSRVEPRRALGKVRAKLGRFEAAALDLELARRISPGDRATESALAAAERLIKRERMMLIAVAGGFALLLSTVMMIANWVGGR
jgi:hypothetical protein